MVPVGIQHTCKDFSIECVFFAGLLEQPQKPREKDTLQSLYQLGYSLIKMPNPFIWIHGAEDAYRRPDIAPLNLLFVQCHFATSMRGTLLIMPGPQTFQLQNADYQTFLLKYHLFLYKQWLFKNNEKSWRKFSQCGGQKGHFVNPSQLISLNGVMNC